MFTERSNRWLSCTRRWWFWPAVAFFVWRAWLYVATVVIQKLERPVTVNGYLGHLEFSTHLPAWVAGWSNFDGAVFLRIAHNGYHYVELPFFPLLPLLMSWLSTVLFISPMLAGLLVSAVSLPLGLWFAAQLWRLDARKSGISFSWFALVLLSFPTAHYFTALYQDALFFALATGTVWFARNRWWRRAVAIACLATLARLNGLALLVFLAAEYWLVAAPTLEKSWGFKQLAQALPAAFHWKTWFGSRKFVWLFLLIPLTFVGYLAWIQYRFGDWHLFFSGVAVWNRDRFILPPQTFWRYAKILALTVSWSLVYFVAVAEAAFTALYGVILAQQWGKLRLSYWLWMVAHLTIPVVTGTLQGMPRYGLHLYPLFLVLALWTGTWPRWAKVMYVAIGLAGQIWFALWFLRGYFVA